jgi:TRIAD3 protein (E3 ubiquitin-protein ligase RNF216)
VKDPKTLIQSKLNETLVRICPRCQAQFLKELGCNRMECPRCQTWFCYYCRQVIPKEIGYEHFWRGKGKPPKGACPLFMNTKKFNKIEVETRRHEMEAFFAARPDDEETDDEEEEQPPASRE